MKKEGIADVLHLKSWFTSQFANHLYSKGRELIGWDEIISGGLPGKAAVMSWHGISGGQAAAKAGHDVVMTPMEFCYFDYYQFTVSDGYPYLGGMNPLHNVYSFNPLIGLEGKYWPFVLGPQANIWSEYVTDKQNMEWKGFIRGAALAEIQWTELSNKNWSRFFSGLVRVEYDRLKRMGVNAAPPALGKPASWVSGSIPNTWVTKDWDVSGAFADPGPYGCIFVYTGGENALHVRNVKLYVNDQVVGVDAHEGIAFEPCHDNVWKFEVKSGAKNQPIKIEAEVRCEGGTDSNGEIFVYQSKGLAE
jgi:hypothetical protein